MNSPRARTVAHLSDLHFGKHSPEVVSALLADLVVLAPQTILISGDLTQRATRSEYAAAAEFLAALPAPYLVVPGNHDIPLWRLDQRLLKPFANYWAAITTELDPFCNDGTVAVLGLNTVRAGVWKSGRISERQTELIRSSFAAIDDSVLKVLVTHHPFIPPPSDPEASVVAHSEAALAVAEEVGVDLLLAGHRHESHAVGSRERYPFVEREMLFVLAGTACSTRVRSENNSYNVIRTLDGGVTLTVRELADGERFETSVNAEYRDSHGGWVRTT